MTLILGQSKKITNNSADDIEKALLALDTVSNVRVTQESVGDTNIWEVAFLGPTGQVVPADASQSATVTANETLHLSVENVTDGNASILRVVKESQIVLETQRITHSGSDGTFSLVFDDGEKTRETAQIPWNATVSQLQAALNNLGTDGPEEDRVKIGTVTVAAVPDQEYNWLVTFDASPDRPQNVLLLRVGENKLESGGEITTAPTEAELRETARRLIQQLGCQTPLIDSKAMRSSRV